MVIKILKTIGELLLFVVFLGVIAGPLYLIYTRNKPKKFKKELDLPHYGVDL